MMANVTSCLLLLLVGVLVTSAVPMDRRWIVRRQIDSSEVHNESDPPIKKEGNLDEPKKASRPSVYSMEIESDIKLRYATTRVTSRVANPADVAQETTFHIVLPETAFISGFLMEIDGKVYKASVKEKEKAQAEYQSAIAAGQSAAQVSTSARDANQFTVSVNVEPKAKMNFNLTYEELLTRRRGTYEHAIHVNPGSVVPKLSVRVNINEVLPVVNVNVPALRNNDIQEEAASAKNDIAVIVPVNKTFVSVIYEPTEAQQKNASKDGLQGQFVVQYDVDRSNVDRKGGEVHIVDGYFVHFFAPTTLPPLPKHVVFVLDTSGSMQGIRLEQTKQAMISILDQLRSKDVFSVVEFSSDVKEWDLTKAYEAPENPYWYDPEPTTMEPVQEAELSNTTFGSYDDIFAYPVTNASVERAKQFVEKMQAVGGTNINGALLTALNNTQAVQKRIKLTPMIIFLTDGEPTVGETNAESILSNLRKANSDGVVSIFSLAFGTGADYNFLTKVSAHNKGFARKIYEASDATLQLKGFFEEVASPLLNDVRFVYQGNEVDEVTESRVPNYFGGSEFVVAGRLKNSDSLSGNINATSAEGVYYDYFDFRLPPLLPEIPSKNITKKEASFSLEKIWAYLTIQDLLKQRGADTKDSSNITAKALRLSLSYGFVTPLTSLVVVKPNQTDSEADVRPADGNSLDTALGLGGVAQFAPAAAPIFNAMALKRPLTTTSSYSFQGTIGVLESAAIDGGVLPDSSWPSMPSLPETVKEEIIPETEEAEAATTEPEPGELFTMDDWINLFPHNDTYVTVTQTNSTLSLSWEDKLPDQEYNACTANYLKPNQGVCKSVWKCPSAFEHTPTIGTDAVCIIQNKYIGVCCSSVLP